MLQKQLGQFYTDKNIFNNIAFIKWFNMIPLEKRKVLLEPFAGSNGIIKMLNDLGFVDEFVSYDIMPRDEDVKMKDTLLDFPKGYSVCVTNPPFLAKNSAKRRDLEADFENLNDLYEVCLLKCLANTEYLAAIIPESFITNKDFDKTRLHVVISLVQNKIFKDTEHPVCLALFNPNPTKDYLIYRNDQLLGSFNEIKEKEKLFLKYENKHNYILSWHNPLGQIGLQVIDATCKHKKIVFFDGKEIPEDEVNLQSRLRTRLLITDKKGNLLEEKKVIRIIKSLNRFLNAYREETQDIFLTAFKGLRNDSMYRRRLDFTKAREIVDAALSK